MFNRFHKRVKLVGAEIEFNLEGKGVEEWLERLDHFRTSAEDLRSVFDPFGRYMLRSIDRTFISEGRPRRWRALKPATVRERIRQGYGAGPILQRTRSLRYGFRSLPGKKSLRIINTQFYFRFHQQDERAGRIIPRRIMVQLLDQDKAQFTRLFRQEMERD